MHRRPVPSTYQLLGDFLAARSDAAVTLTFAEIEAIIGCPLPPIARGGRSWWRNAERPHQRAWLDAGWKMHHVNVREQTISFVRVAEDDESTDMP